MIIFFMGLFNTKKEVVQASPQRLPDLPGAEDGFLNQSELPDVPPGLPAELQAKLVPEPPRQSITKRGSSDSFQVAQMQSYPAEENLDLDPQKGLGSGIYPFAEPLRRKEVSDILEPPRTKEVNSDYETSSFLDQKPRMESKNSYKPQEKKAEPVFIRLDKFETTIEAFEEIKAKIIEIEDLLKKIKEVKTKEEEELVSWEKEIQVIKTRIDSIDKNIFNKLD
jgi:hypothetical protein